MIQDCIDELIEYISTSGRENDVGMAKELYFRGAGGIFGAEESCDMRVGIFLEWYILDRSLGGKTLIEEYIEKVTDADKKTDTQKVVLNVKMPVQRSSSGCSFNPDANGADFWIILLLLLILISIRTTGIIISRLESNES